MNLKLKAYAKVNISLDITGKREDGYHYVDSLMHGIDVADEVIIAENPKKHEGIYEEYKGLGIALSMAGDSLIADGSNLAVKAAKALVDAVQARNKSIDVGFKSVQILIDKKIPVAAGLAGGSADAAVTLIGINKLMGNIFTLDELIDIALVIGSDVPFSVMMNAKGNEKTFSDLDGINEAETATHVLGTGDIVIAVEPLDLAVIMVNPGIEISTRDAYRNFDRAGKIGKPSKPGMTGEKLFYNALEKYALDDHEDVRQIIAILSEHMTKARAVMMSGSGPTVTAYYDNLDDCEKDYENMLSEHWFCYDWKVWKTHTI